MPPGIEVILDVVYNHTAEGNEMGPTLSFRGLDNASYYRLVPDNPRHCVNDTGTGNTLNLSHAARPADGDGLPALLGDGLPCRRLPLRSRRHPVARESTTICSTREVDRLSVLPVPVSSMQ